MTVLYLQICAAKALQTKRREQRASLDCFSLFGVYAGVIDNLYQFRVDLVCCADLVDCVSPY